MEAAVPPAPKAPLRTTDQTGFGEIPVSVIRAGLLSRCPSTPRTRMPPGSSRSGQPPSIPRFTSRPWAAAPARPAKASMTIRGSRPTPREASAAQPVIWTRCAKPSPTTWGRSRIFPNGRNSPMTPFRSNWAVSGRVTTTRRKRPWTRLPKRSTPSSPGAEAA